MHDNKSITDAVRILRETDTARLTCFKVYVHFHHQAIYAYVRQEFNLWLLNDFAPKCDTDTRKQLRSSLTKGCTRSKARGSWEDAFRRDTWTIHSKTPEKSPKWVLAALNDLETQSQLGQHSKLLQIDPHDFWTAQIDITTDSTTLNPLNRLMSRYDTFKRLEQRGKHGRRFTALLIWYQVYQELNNARAENRLGMADTSNVAGALEKVASDHEVNVEDIVKCRTEATGWMRFAQVFGPGAMLLAGVNAMYVG